MERQKVNIKKDKKIKKYQRSCDTQEDEKSSTYIEKEFSKGKVDKKESNCNGKQ